MKILIRETGNTAQIFVYAVNERECTYEFFLKHFSDVRGIYETSDEEREIFSADAEWTVESGDVFDELAEVLAEYSECIAGIRMQALDYGISPENYVFNGNNYVML